METESSESAVQVPVEPAKPELKPKKKKKATLTRRYRRELRNATAIKAAKQKQEKTKPAVKRHTSKNGAARKAKQTKRPVLRACRMDIRLTRAEREKITRKATAMRRTVTSIVAELIEKMK